MSSKIVDCPVSYGSLLECNISYPYIHVNIVLLNHKGSLLPQTHDTHTHAGTRGEKPTQVALKLQTLAGLQDEERYVLWVYFPK